MVGLDQNTATISALKSSVDSMSDQILQQNSTVSDSIRMNNDNITSIKAKLNQTQNLIESSKKLSYASILKNSNDDINDLTPKSSRASPVIKKQKTILRPAIDGKSNVSIGKPLSPPRNQNHQNRSEKFQKAIWVSRLHRETTEEEITLYIKEKLNITAVDEFKVHKLVKRDREISSYSFVSFKVNCSANLFKELLDENKWPNTCKIREFDNKIRTSPGSRLNEILAPQKNESNYSELGSAGNSSSVESKNGTCEQQVLLEI